MNFASVTDVQLADREDLVQKDLNNDNLVGFKVGSKNKSLVFKVLLSVVLIVRFKCELFSFIKSIAFLEPFSNWSKPLTVAFTI